MVFEIPSLARFAVSVFAIWLMTRPSVRNTGFLSGTLIMAIGAGLSYYVNENFLFSLCAPGLVYDRAITWKDIRTGFVTIKKRLFRSGNDN